MSPLRRPDASIIIPTYNRAALLSEALQSVRELEIPHNWRVELLVIDNNSTDGTEGVVTKSAQLGGPVEHRYVRELQQGLSHARNRGLAEAATDWAIFLDDDMLVAPQWLLSFKKVLDDYSADLVTGPVEPRFESAVPPWCDQSILDSVTSSYSLRGDGIRALVADERHEIPGCNFAVRTAAALAAGGFDASFGRSEKGMLAGEDWEFARRIAGAGGSVYYAPGCRIRHLVSSEKLSRAGLLARWRGLGASAKAIRARHPSAPRALPP